MIILKSDFSVQCAEDEYETEATAMIYMALFAAGLPNSLQDRYQHNVEMSAKALTEKPDDPDAGIDFRNANNAMLAASGIQIENIKHPPPEEGHYPVIITSIYRGFDNRECVVKIERGFVCDEENYNLYENNSIGWG